MEIDSTIPLKTQTPDMFGTIGKMLDIGNKSVELTKGRETLQANIERAKAESSTAQTQAIAAKWKLDTEQGNLLRQWMSGAINDPGITDPKTGAPATDTDKAVETFMEIKERALANGFSKGQAEVNFAYPLFVAAHNPQALQPLLKKFMVGGINPAGQAQAITPSGPGFNTGQQSGQMNTNPLGGAPGPIPGTVTQNVLPPTTPTVQPGTNQPGYLGPQNQPGGFVPSQPPLGAVQNVADLQKEVTAIRQAGDQVPVQRNINQNILKLSRSTISGPGTQYWQQGLAAAGLGQFGDNYQELGKFLEKNAIQNMQAMGGQPSDARLSAAAAANGSTQFNPGALQMVTKFNDATTSAIDKYRQGMDKAVASGNFAEAAKFKSDWAKNLDIDIFRVENAIRDKDTMELQRIRQELGSDRMRELAKKRKNLETLSANGKL